MRSLKKFAEFSKIQGDVGKYSIEKSSEILGYYKEITKNDDFKTNIKYLGTLFESILF